MGCMTFSTLSMCQVITFCMDKTAGSRPRQKFSNIQMLEVTEKEKKHSYKQRQPQSKSCRCQRKSAVTHKNKYRLKFCRETKQHQHCSQQNTDRGHVALALSFNCPGLSFALAAIHLLGQQLTRGGGPQRLARRAKAKGGVMRLSANQARRPVSLESRLSFPADAQAPQPGQRSSAVIFINGGAASCHSQGESTIHTSPPHTHRTLKFR